MARSIPISKTKIVVPHRRPELLSRPRLLEGLRAALDRKLILLSAPAGYGKTSLLVDFAYSTELPVCWLSLDPLDRDPQRFMAYVVAALAEKFPGLAAPLEPLLNELKSIEHDAEPLLVALTNELYEQVEQDFLLIIDDYHLLDEVPVISALLNRFVHLADENCHVILSSRIPPALPDLALMLAREQVEGFSQVELAFLPREIQAFFAQNLRQHLSDQSAAELVEQTGGWITGVILSNQAGTSGISNADAFSYLGDQVLEQQAEPLRVFLLRTSLADDFSAELAQMMLAPLYTEQQNWSDLMDEVLRKNLFVLPLGGASEDWLRYHPLFREFLQARLKKERPQEVPQILKRLTDAYEQRGEWEKAYYTCQQLGDTEILANVIEAGGSAMLRQAFSTLDGWLNGLPPALVRNRPGLVSLRGAIANNKGNFADAITLLDKVVAVYRSRIDTSGLSLALVRRAFALRMLGDYDRSLEDTEEAAELAESQPDLQSVFAEALRIKGLNLHRLGKTRQASEYLERSLALFTNLGVSGGIPTLLQETAMVYLTLGDVETAKTRYQQALTIWRARKNVYAQASIMNDLAVLNHLVGDYEGAARAFEDGLLYARRGRNQRVEALILLGLGDLYTEVEDYESAVLAYQNAEPIVKEYPGSFLEIYLILARANLALQQSNTQLARLILKNSRRKLDASPSFYEQGLRGLIRARIQILENRPARAISMLETAKAALVSDGREVEIIWARIWLAVALLSAGETDAARNELSAILGGSRDPNHATLVTLRQSIRWLKSMRKDPQIGRNLTTLMEKSRQLEERLPAIRRALRRQARSIQISAPSLVIRAFGRTEVRLDGRVVSISEWSAQPVRDLLFYFLYRRKAVTKEQIATAFWPEVDDPQIIKQRFKTYIFRLRRATRRDVIIFDEEHYRFNDALDYEYDVEAFQTYLSRARTSRETDERMEYFQKAVEIASGPYLVDVDALWALEERERLSQTHLAALEELAGLYLDANRLDEAIALSLRALDADVYRETVHQIAMRAYAARGERSAVARQYRTCREALRSIDMAPSAETEALFRDLAA